MDEPGERDPDRAMAGRLPDASQAAIEAALPRHPFMSCRNKAQDLKISRRAVYRDWRAIAAQYRSKSVFDFARPAE